jgi:hypothetical protein
LSNSSILQFLIHGRCLPASFLSTSSRWAVAEAVVLMAVAQVVAGKFELELDSL